MNRKQKIQELLNRLNSLKEERLELPAYIDTQLSREKANSVTSAETSPTALAIRRVGKDLNKIQRSPAVKNLFKLLRKAEYTNLERFEKMSNDFSEKLDALASELTNADSRGQTNEAYLKQLYERLSGYIQDFEKEKINSETSSTLLRAEYDRLERELRNIEEGTNKALLEGGFEVNNVSAIASEALKTAVEATSKVDSIPDSLKKLESDLLSRIAKIGGGNMNRNIAIGGNTSVLSMFNDINLKPGTGVTITYANNIATNFTDVTISATGSGSGITREINNVAINTNAGASAGIDYVYLVSGTTAITLPTAVGNTNLYTIKNVGNGIVTVNTTGGETIDDDSNVIMPVKYTAVDIISNGTNWKIT